MEKRDQTESTSRISRGKLVLKRHHYSSRSFVKSPKNSSFGSIEVWSIPMNIRHRNQEVWRSMKNMDSTKKSVRFGLVFVAKEVLCSLSEFQTRQMVRCLVLFDAKNVNVFLWLEFNASLLDSTKNQNERTKGKWLIIEVETKQNHTPKNPPLHLDSRQILEITFSQHLNGLSLMPMSWECLNSVCIRFVRESWKAKKRRRTRCVKGTHSHKNTLIDVWFNSIFSYQNPNANWIIARTHKKTLRSHCCRRRRAAIWRHMTIIFGNAADIKGGWQPYLTTILKD